MTADTAALAYRSALDGSAKRTRLSRGRDGILQLVDLDRGNRPEDARVVGLTELYGCVKTDRDRSRIRREILRQLSPYLTKSAQSLQSFTDWSDRQPVARIDTGAYGVADRQRRLAESASRDVQRRLDASLNAAADRRIAAFDARQMAARQACEQQARKDQARKDVYAGWQKQRQAQTTAVRPRQDSKDDYGRLVDAYNKSPVVVIGPLGTYVRSADGTQVRRVTDADRADLRDQSRLLGMYGR